MGNSNSNFESLITKYQDLKHISYQKRHEAQLHYEHDQFGKALAVHRISKQYLQTGNDLLKKAQVLQQSNKENSKEIVDSIKKMLKDHEKQIKKLEQEGDVQLPSELTDELKTEFEEITYRAEVTVTC